MAITFSNGFTISSPSLYPFSLFTFTTTGISGSAGPTLVQLRTAYTGSASWTSNPSYFTTGAFQGYQMWTVPQTATYQVEIAGAASGISSYPVTYSGSKGAIIRANVSLTQGQKILMVVGQRSLNTATSGLSYIGVGGGGGSYFVLSGSNTPLLIAGGAGGQGAYSGDVMGFPGQLKSGSLDGNGSTSTTGSRSRNFAPGGTGSLGGRTHINTGSVVSSNIYDGGGGSGFLGNGFNGDGTVTKPFTNANYGGGGLSFLSGSTGGNAASSFTPNQATQGGFGGGGGGTPIAGGGGGGYAGGAGSWGSSQPASDGGGGGSSYINSSASSIATSDGNYDGLSSFSGSAITNINSFNSGSGYIKVTLIG